MWWGGGGSRLSMDDDAFRKVQAQFATMQVRNATYSAFIEGFTSTTYVMVIVSDPTIEPATTLINIDASRSHFESLINSLNSATPMPPGS